MLTFGDKPQTFDKPLIIERCQYDYSEEWESDSDQDSEVVGKLPNGNYH